MNDQWRMTNDGRTGKERGVHAAESWAVKVRSEVEHRAHVSAA
jgi:hypothetical protein